MSANFKKNLFNNSNILDMKGWQVDTMKNTNKKLVQFQLLVHVDGLNLFKMHHLQSKFLKFSRTP